MLETETFSNWLTKLKDKHGKARILAHIASARAGNFGGCDSMGERVSEMRIHVGLRYCVYFAQEGACVYLLLTDGNKSEQKQDIKEAKAMWRAIREGGRQ